MLLVCLLTNDVSSCGNESELAVPTVTTFALFSPLTIINRCEQKLRTDRKGNG